MQKNLLFVVDDHFAQVVFVRAFLFQLVSQPTQLRRRQIVLQTGPSEANMIDHNIRIRRRANISDGVQENNMALNICFKNKTKYEYLRKARKRSSLT